jgi:ferredoxin-NADP reductase
MPDKVKIRSIENLTHDVLRIVADKPAALSYQPGQAVDVSINKPGWENELRPFTFTSLPEEDHIEFSIKTYPDHNGVTAQLLTLKPGDELIIGDVFGDINYKGEGMFIAGGAGVTPFIAIFKNLEKEKKIGNNQLLFANKTQSDIILKSEFEKMLSTNFINVLSDDKDPAFEHGFITQELIKKHSKAQNKYYYLCGPPPMMDAIGRHLAALNIPSEFVVKEAF